MEKSSPSIYRDVHDLAKKPPGVSIQYTMIQINKTNAIENKDYQEKIFMFVY